MPRRDPSCLEVLGSSSSDDNKTLLTSSLYMGTKSGAGLHLTSTSSLQLLQSQLSPEKAKGGRAGHFPARKSTEMRVNTRRSDAARPGGGAGGTVPNIQTTPGGLATLAGGGQIMTALLPPGMQPRRNLATGDATGIEVHRYNESPPSVSSSQHASAIAMGVIRKFPEFSPAGAEAVGAKGAEAQDAEAQTPREAGKEMDEGRDLLKLQARLSKKPDSTEFVYLRPYLPDADAPVAERLTPLNPYHIEVVPHAQGVLRVSGCLSSLPGDVCVSAREILDRDTETNVLTCAHTCNYPHALASSFSCRHSQPPKTPSTMTQQQDHPTFSYQ